MSGARPFRTKLNPDEAELITFQIAQLRLADGLTKWESDFVDSVAEQFEGTGSLSPKQRARLSKIYEDRT